MQLSPIHPPPSRKRTTFARFGLTLVMVAILSGPVLAQESAQPATPPVPEWSLGVSGGWYMLPDEADYVQPTVRADRGRLHLETRYAYEDRESLSFFAGVNLEFGKDVKVAITPMIGGVAGALDGVIPAAEIDISAWRIEAYGEAEYVFDLNDSTSRFFYMWSEVSVWATEWLRGGLVTQRTRVYQTERDIQRGPFVGFAFSKIEAAFYAFNPGADDHLAVLSVSFSF